MHRLIRRLAVTLLALGVHNLPLAVPGLLNVGCYLNSGKVPGWAIVSLAAFVNAALCAGSLAFLASGQSFEQFTGIETVGLAAPPTPSASSEEPMEDRQVAALVEMMRAVNAGDAAAYARLYAPDAVITIHGTGVLEGRTAIEAHELELMSQFPGARLAFDTVWQKGPSAVVHYGVNGRTSDGAAMGHEGLLFYRFQTSGLIETEQRYLDSLTPMAQLGLLGPGPARPLPTLPAGLRKQVATGLAQERENVSLVTTSLAALDSRNEAAFLATMAADAVVDEMIDANPPTGPSNVKAWFDIWTGALPQATTEIISSVAAGDFVLMETVVRSTLTGPLGRVLPSNTAIELHRALIVEVKGGKVRRITAFMNGKELAQAAGQWPPAGAGQRP